MAERAVPFINYYAREGMYRHIQTVCGEVLKMRSIDPVFIFWRAFGLMMEGSTSDAMREFQGIRDNTDVGLASTAALVNLHENAKVVDYETLTMLSTQLEMEERNASEPQALRLATLLLHIGSKERARLLVERLQREDGGSPQVLCLLAWIMVHQQLDPYDNINDPSELDEALELFDATLKLEKGNVEAQLGKAKCFEIKQQLGRAVEVVTETHLRNEWFIPALVEKAKLLLSLNEWDQATETTARILQVDSQNITALGLTALSCIIRDGKNKVAAEYIKDISTSLSKNEPRSASLYLQMAQSFRCLAGQDEQILDVTKVLADKALALQPSSTRMMVEVGYQRLQAGNIPGAQEMFTQAAQVDELSIEANYGLVECHVMAGELQEAQDQLSFLKEMRTTMGAGAEAGDEPLLKYLHAMLAAKQMRPEACTLMERAVQSHLNLVASMPPSFDLYIKLNPSRLLQGVSLMLAQAGSEPRSPTEPPSPILAKIIRILDTLARYLPMLVDCQQLLAHALYLNANYDAAQRKVADLLRLNSSNTHALLMTCNIYLQQGKAGLALSALNQAVSASFAIRETAAYHVVHGRTLMANNCLEEARQVLEAGMNLPGVRTPLTAQQRTRLQKRSLEPPLHERCSMYLLLAEVLSKLSKLPDAPEAKKYITDALREFQGTEEEVRVMLAECKISLAQGNTQLALKHLRKVAKESPHYTKARIAMADIYIKHQNNKAAYIKCYMDLKEQDMCYDTCCMLGEALLAIQQPQEAVKEFEAALQYNPKDVELASKISKALIMTHDYQRAIDYYNKAIRNSPTIVQLQHDLALLLIRLRQWNKAKDVLQRCLDRSKEMTSALAVEYLTADIESWLLMARLYKDSNDMHNYTDAQVNALELQTKLVSQIRGEVSEVVLAAKVKAATICADLAQHYQNMRNNSEAMSCYNQALQFSDSHVPSMLSLAKLHLAMGNNDSCQTLLTRLLRLEPENEEAAVMLAELMTNKEHYDTAIYHYHQILEKKPNRYDVLLQLLQLLRRDGRMTDIPKMIEAAEAGRPKASMDAGLHVCKGLHNRYLGKPREALQEFNLARNDGEWGTTAVLHMAEIYLNPDNDAIWEEKENLDTAESREATSTARSLLEQVKVKDRHLLKFKVLDCYAIMASFEKSDVSAALSELLDLANEDPNSVPVILAMATAFMLQKAVPKARNQLKRVTKIPYKSAEGEEFERCWLLLANIHMQGGKYDLAQELCQKCLKYNKSCAKAWDMMGAIMEHESSFKDAASHYESAWKCDFESSPQIGFKLAFNYLKAKRFVDAVDVCSKVLKAFPDYPKIRKEVLEKARQGLRP